MSYRTNTDVPYDLSLLSKIPDPTRAEEQPHLASADGYSPGGVALANMQGQLVKGHEAATFQKVPWYRTRRGVTAIAIALVLVIVIIIGGAVGGSKHHSHNNSADTGGGSGNTSTSESSTTGGGIGGSRASLTPTQTVAATTTETAGLPGPSRPPVGTGTGGV